jgi:HSP20 family protein
MTTTLQTSQRQVELTALSRLEKTIGNTGKPVVLPVINMDETNGEYIIYMAMPGMRRENFGITVNQSALTISAGKKENVQSFDDHCEYDYCGWTRSFRLPADADTVMATAAFRNGELVIHIPKAEDILPFQGLAIYVY